MRESREAAATSSSSTTASPAGRGSVPREWARSPRASTSPRLLRDRALLALDGKWQRLDKIRILMGAETTASHEEGVPRGGPRARARSALDESIEAEKDPNPFLDGVPAIVEALKCRQIECRVYDEDKFHAKAYITHAKLEVVGSQALVGSSNFTRPGLTAEHRAQHPGPERARGRAAPGVVRGALGEARTSRADVLADRSSGTFASTRRSRSTRRRCRSSSAATR